MSEHQGETLNTTTIRDILENKLELLNEWTTVNEYIELIDEYHAENGGQRSNLKYHSAHVRLVLKELTRFGQFESYKEGNKFYFKPV